MRTGAARVYLCTCVPVYLISHRASDKFPLLRQAQHKVSIRVRAATRPARRWNHPCSDTKSMRTRAVRVYLFTCVLVYLST